MILELFAGPGGWSTGLRLAGHTGGPAVGIEWDLDACRTATAAGHTRICADVADYPTAPFAGRVEGLIASPPCQAWSRAGKGLGLRDEPVILAHTHQVAAAGHWLPYPASGWHDPRSPLVLEVLRWVLDLRPRWFAVEQVPAVLPYWRLLAHILGGRGYSTVSWLAHAEEYGVPQTRQRAILTGSLTSAVSVPAPTHQRYTPGRAPQDDLFGGLQPWVSMAEALGWGLDARPAWTVTAGGTDTGGAEVFGNARNRERLRGLGLHSAAGPRVTVEEAAALQGFPPDYPWQGNQGARYRQVGDAVPPPLAAAILRPLLAPAVERAA